MAMSETPEVPGMQIVQPDEKLKINLWIGTIVGWILLLVIAGFLWFKLLFQIGPVGFNYGGPLVLLIIAHIFVLSLKKVDGDELGALYFYGDYIRKLRPGLHIIPAGGPDGREEVSS